jgi:uncharacterized protein (TIGR02996 family)
MTDCDALLAAILTNPDEDTPRLVYADWLQENDEPERAEFIRLQCRLEQISRRSVEGRWLAKREQELQPKLFGHLNALGFANITFRRGFVGTITSGLLALRDNLDKLRLEDAPAYELAVGWGEAEDDQYDDYDFQIVVTQEAFSRRTLRRCIALDLPCMGMGPSEPICESKHLTNLRRFNFPSNEAGPYIEAIASPVFKNLRWANFYNSDSAADCPSIVPLAACRHLANLEYLDFGACEQWDEGAIAVAEAKQWKRLHFLSMSVSTFSVDVVAKLFATKHLPALQELDLSHSFNSPTEWDVVGNGDPFVPAIADSPLLTRLKVLRLAGNGITDKGAKALAASPRELNLTQIDLSGNPITAVGKRALRKRFGAACVFKEADE